MLSFVLSRKDFKECDQVISLYTLEKGKVEALAKGVKKIISKNAASLEPFSFIEAEIVPGKQIDRVTRVQNIKLYKNIRADLAKCLAAGYTVNFLDKILQPGAPDKELFNLLGGWLDFLDTSVVFQPILLDAFFVKLYRILGFDMTETSQPSAILKFLQSGNWTAINDFKTEDEEAKTAHQEILKFVEFHTERPVKDWVLSCQF